LKISIPCTLTLAEAVKMQIEAGLIALGEFIRSKDSFFARVQIGKGDQFDAREFF
jgi:hypothetical protein